MNLTENLAIHWVKDNNSILLILFQIKKVLSYNF